MEAQELDFTKVKIYGTDYDAARDRGRLTGALARVYEIMLDGKKRRTEEMGELARCPAASAHRHLSTLRTQYGLDVKKEYIADGLFVYWIEKGEKIKFNPIKRELKPVGNKELWGAMMQAIYAYSVEQDFHNHSKLNIASSNWAQALAGEIGNIKYKE